MQTSLPTNQVTDHPFQVFTAWDWLIVRLNSVMFRATERSQAVWLMLLIFLHHVEVFG